MVSSIPSDLSEAVHGFDRRAVQSRVVEARRQAEQIRASFPLDGWPSLLLERYAVGLAGSKTSFCYQLEFGSPELGSIRGGSSRKLIIYARQDGSGWYFDPAFSTVEDAWDKLRSSFVQAFALAERGSLAEVDDIAALRSGPALTAKALYVYFPGELLPIYAQAHVRHFIERLTGTKAPTLTPIAANRRLLELIRADACFEGWDPIQVMNFLYWWTDPRAAPAIVKIAPGEGARFWPECRDGGFICVGWDDVGDLGAFASEEDFKAAFASHYPHNGNQSAVTRKARELWRLTSLGLGDRVVANEGQSKVLAVGTVVEPGYVWRPDRAEFKHTVTVSWDESYARSLSEPVKQWGVTTVAEVPGTLWRTITGEQPTIAQPPSRDGAPALAPVVLATTDQQLQSVAQGLERKGQVILFGPPGTGKTFTALRFAVWWLGRSRDDVDPLASYGTDAFKAAVAALSSDAASAGAPEPPLPARPEVGQLTQVTFHPSYTYEDFIEGFKPVSGRDGGLNLRLVDGIFKRVCAAAREDPNRSYLVVIDEINRGNIPKIFGELITLLEIDKRGLRVQLPQSGDSFAVPGNVYVLATMNTADRSIRLLDAALRRRFAFQELLPDAEPLEGAFVGKLHLADLLTNLNARVRGEVGRERQVGQAFLLRDGRPLATDEELGAAVRGDIIPLLQEYAYDDYSLLTRLLGSGLVDETEQRIRDLADADLVDALYTELQTVAGDPPL